MVKKKMMTVRMVSVILENGPNNNTGGWTRGTETQNKEMFNKSCLVGTFGRCILGGHQKVR